MYFIIYVYLSIHTSESLDDFMYSFFLIDHKIQKPLRLCIQLDCYASKARITLQARLRLTNG